MHKSIKHALAAALLSASVWGQTSARTFDDEIQLVGTVRGMPARTGCSVELSNVRGPAVSQQAMCGMDGSFQFVQVPRGVYNLVVKMGTNEYSEEVSLESPREQVEIDLPAARPRDGSQNYAKAKFVTCWLFGSYVLNKAAAGT